MVEISVSGVTGGRGKRITYSDRGTGFAGNSNSPGTRHRAHAPTQMNLNDTVGVIGSL
jgi:hypothetical protein